MFGFRVVIQIICFFLFTAAVPSAAKSISLDEIYVINIDPTLPRYLNTKKILSDHDLEHALFNGTHAKELTIKDKNNNLIKGGDLISGRYSLILGDEYRVNCSDSFSFDYKEKHKGDKYPMSAGEFGCVCSHLLVWKNIVQNSYSYSLVLEDDIALIPDFNKHFRNVLDNIPEECDVVYIDADLPDNIRKRFRKICNSCKWAYDLDVALHESFKQSQENLDNQYIHAISDSYYSVYLTSAYLITLKGASKLLNQMQVISYPIDLEMSKVIKSGKIKACKAKTVDGKNIIFQDTHYKSVINQYGRQ